jgi:hypothetical protein
VKAATALFLMSLCPRFYELPTYADASYSSRIGKASPKWVTSA